MSHNSPSSSVYEEGENSLVGYSDLDTLPSFGSQISECSGEVLKVVKSKQVSLQDEDDLKKGTEKMSLDELGARPSFETLSSEFNFSSNRFVPPTCAKNTIEFVKPMENGLTELENVNSNQSERADSIKSSSASVSSFTRDLLALRKTRQQYRRFRDGLNKGMAGLITTKQGAPQRNKIQGQPNLVSMETPAVPPLRPTNLRQWWGTAAQMGYSFSNSYLQPSMYPFEKTPPKSTVQFPVTRSTIPVKDPFAYPPFSFWKVPQGKAGHPNVVSFKEERPHFSEAVRNSKPKVSLTTERFSLVTEYLQKRKSAANVP